MNKRRRLICSPIHMEQLSLYQNQDFTFYSSYRSYFLGDRVKAEEINKTHIDLGAYSVAYGPISAVSSDLALAKNLQKYTYASTAFFYRKLRFTGKGYKIKKSRLKKSFKLYFGRSHRQYLFSGGLRFKKLSKYRLYLLSNNRKKLNRIM